MGFVPFMDNGSNYGRKASRAEKRKQARIDEGMQRINAVFEGGSYPVYTAATSFDPSQQYYTASKTGGYQPFAVNPENAPFNALPGFDPFAKAKRMATKGRLYTKSDSQRFEGFQPGFYDQRRQAYLDFALPQLEDQYGSASRSLTYGLANRGLLHSGSALRRTRELNREYGLQRQGVYDVAQGQAQALRNQVEEARQRAISQLYQTADPAQAQQAAISTASSAAAPSAFAPIGNAFASLANQYYTNQAFNQYRTNNSPSVSYNPGNYDSALPKE